MSQLITIEEALTRIRERASVPVRTEVVPLEYAIRRRIAADVIADDPWPVTDRSAMDGFACATGGEGVAAGAAMPVVGEALAGHPFDGSLAVGQAVRIMTGGVVPDGADTVVMVEKTSGFDGDSVRFDDAVQAGANIRRRGSEIAPGTKLIARGARIRSAEIGSLAVLGRAEVDVARRPIVSVLSTGDEVVPIDRAPLPHQVRDSNAWALAAQIEEAGGEARRLGIASDDEASLRGALSDGFAHSDVVLTIGGVSKGTHDLVHGTLRELGVEEVFHGVIVKPGKPLYFGQRAEDGTFVFGLPGNPASASTTFHVFVRPLLERLLGAPDRPDIELPVAGASFRKNWRAQLIPGRRVWDASGVRIELTAVRPSGDPFSFAEADGLAWIPADADPADVVRARFLPFEE